MADIRNVGIPHEATGVGPPPDHMRAASAAAWDELVALAPQRQWLKSDRIWLEVTAETLVRVRENPDPEFTGILLVMLSKGLLGRDALDKLGIEHDGEWPVEQE